MTLKLTSFAKINLFLYITSKREDGYHTLYSLMTPIDLCDDLYLDFEADRIKVVCSHPQVTEDESNLAHRAAVLFYQALGEKAHKVVGPCKQMELMCDPGVAAATAAVYKRYDFELTSTPKYTMNAGLNVLIGGREFDAGAWMHNDLEGPACRLYPEIWETKEEMELLLHTKVRMTGSGSSLFALFQARKDAEKGCEILLEKWAGSKRNLFISSFG